MNVICLGSEVIGPEVATDLVQAFLAAEFQPEERYLRRLKKIEEMERAMMNA
jgi:ribose 5-phosphate isomerase B